MHILCGCARLVEGSLSNDTKLMRDRVVIDDAAGASDVQAGVGNEIEHDGGEIRLSAGQQVPRGAIRAKSAR